MSQSINQSLYTAMYALPTNILHDTLVAARAFCAARSGRPCPRLAYFVEDPANAAISREVIQRLRDGTLLSDDNPVVESKT